MTSTRQLLFLSGIAVGLAVPTVAAAQPSNPACPPGSWFCEEQKPPPPPQPQLQPLPPPDQAAPPAPPRPPRPPVVYAPYQPYQPYQPYRPGPPVVVYQPPPPVMLVRPEAPPPYIYRRPAPMSLTPPREWGLNLHLEGAMLGHGLSGSAGMGGAGFGLRYKPSPFFGVETDLDFVGGTDYNGYSRNETAFTVNGMVFLNPRSRAQVYLLGGFGWSNAHLGGGGACDSTGYCVDSYSYFGGQAGVGLELRLTRHFALNADIRGFIRGRIDGDAQSHPEFVNANGQTTNTSGGGLFTAGATFYF